jgi:hypothetical protein
MRWAGWSPKASFRVTIGVILLANCVAAGQTVQITDDQFLDGNWTHYLRPDSESGSQTISRQVTADNPTGYQEGIHTWSNGTIRTAHILSGQTYTPSSKGPITSVDLGFAFRMTTGSGNNKNTQAGLLLRQGGQTYVYALLQTFSASSTWNSASFTGLTTSDFGLVGAGGVNGNAHPDFSCTGGTIELGYTVVNTSTKSSNSVTWNADSFLVTIHQASTGDCNSNGISDECEVANGLVPDCNCNGIPDSCDIAAGTSRDCNGNGIPDECDIASGNGTDTNHDGIPDECQSYVCGPQWLEDLPPVDGTVRGATTWDPDGDGPRPPLLIVGGGFSRVGSVPASNIAAFDGTNWSPLGSGTNEIAWAFAVYQGDLIVGGRFTTAGGSPANYVARWNGTTWSPMGSGLNMYVNALTIHNGNLYAGGWFTQHVAMWDGSNWVQAGPEPPSSVNTLLSYNGELYAGGSFTMSGGVSTYNIARWNSTRWTYLGNLIDGTDGAVSCLATYNNLLIVGGWFTHAGGKVANCVATWSGRSWQALGGGMSYQVSGLAVNGPYLFAGGYFGSAGGLPASNIARWDGTAWSALGSGMNSVVQGLGVFEGDLIAVGDFTTAGGISSTHWARWRDPPPPEITLQPSTQAVLAGQDVCFAVGASGFSPQPLQYQWRKDGSALPAGARFSGTNTAQLTIANARPADSGSYDVVVTDCKSTTSWGAYLLVACPLAASSPSLPTSVNTGEVAVISVTISGASGTPHFLWRRNGEILSDDFHISGSASSTMTISPAGGRDSGSYSVVVMDDCGSLTSSSAWLSVLCPARIPADLDSDCDVDRDDLAIFGVCAGGPAVPAVVGSGCPAWLNDQRRVGADFDADNDVDQNDFGLFQRCYSGANRPADPNCAP